MTRILAIAAALLLSACAQTGVETVSDGTHTMKKLTIADAVTVTVGCVYVRNDRPKEVLGTGCGSDVQPWLKGAAAAAAIGSLWRIGPSGSHTPDTITVKGAP